MKIYTKEDLNNLRTDEKETILVAEKSYITFGSGDATIAFKLSEVIIALNELIVKSKVKPEKIKLGKKKK